MKEQDILNTISKIIGNDYIGDDCAYLKDIGIVVTQDSLIENIHFKRNWYTPYQLGYKSIAVNISDILASGAVPKYITIALSLPRSIDNNFVKQFYEGATACLHGASIVGGDITGSENDIVISVTAIGTTLNRYISSRKNAKIGYVIVTKGNHGVSALGLNELINNGSNQDFINSHIKPELEFEFAESIATTVSKPYAMMDTSDGLCDALFKIAESSNVKISVDYNKIPHLNSSTKEQVLFGGEDYKLVAAIPAEYLKYINGAEVIGQVEEYDGIRLDISGDKFIKYEDLNVFNHF